MDSFLISYDLVRNHRNYDAIINRIKEFDGWCHCLESVWIIKSNLNSEQIRNTLENFVDNNDKVLVVKLSGQGAWYNLDEEISGWLINNL